MSFSMSHTVTLRHPISVVFPVLSDSKQLERLQRLTPEAQTFTFLNIDHVRLPAGGLAPLVRVAPERTPPITESLHRLPTIDAVEVEAEGHESHSPVAGKVVERVWFEFGGTVLLLFGLIHSPLSVTGVQIVDEDARIVLFESRVVAKGIKEVKLRTFEAVGLEDGTQGTVVKETVWGTCPTLLSYLLKIIAPGVHKDHMEMLP
jgi:hypothetical protein